MVAKFSLGTDGEFRVGVADLDRSEAFYQGKLGLRLLRRDGRRVCYQGDEMRLLIEEAADHDIVRPASPVYFRVSDIVAARRELESRGVVFVDTIQMVAPMEGYDLWATTFLDPDGHRLALLMEGPKGFQP